MNLNKIEANLQRRFADRLIYLKEKPGGMILVKRKRFDVPNRDAVLLSLPKGASRDYILRRMYEMDTWEKTMAERDLDKDTTEKRIREYEVRKRAKEQRKRWKPSKKEMIV